MLRARLSEKIAAAIGRLTSEGKLPATATPHPDVEPPRQAEHGDFATNWALVAAKTLGANPRALAESLAEALRQDPHIARVDVAGPGFVNLLVTSEFLSDEVGRAVVEGADYARTTPDRPLRINVEFVSVNPNGPITIGSGRGAAYGDSLCNVLAAAGHTVHREYYINDGVNSEQMRLFAESVRALALGEPLPEGGYRGDYVEEVARQLVGGLESGLAAQAAYVTSTLEGLDGVATDDESDRLRLVLQRGQSCIDRLRALLTAHDVPATLRAADTMDLKYLCELLMTDRQADDLAAFGVTFDTWFSEQTLHDSGQVDAEIATLAEHGVADDRPVRTKLKLGKGGVVDGVELEAQPGESGTLWLRSTRFGDDQDRVLRRSDGRLTYIASDVAYHKDKFRRPLQADKLITVLGPDHHGYIGRLQAVVAAMLLSEGLAPATATGLPLEGPDAEVFDSPEQRDACRAALSLARERLDVLIFQLVRFMKDGEPAPMRKRDGNIYALIDLINEIGSRVRPDGSPGDQRQAGRDVARFFYLMRNHDTTFDFDLDLAARQSDDNPVFYVQYAHARICSVIAKAEESGLSVPTRVEGPAELHEKERALILKLSDLAHEVRRAAEDYSVNRIATYAIELARTYHHFYDACRVVAPDDPATSSWRLALCAATRSALATSLGLLGVSAPERMARATAETSTGA